MKKVLVTGAGGFFGSHLVERLIDCGYDVRAFIHYNSNNSYGWLEDFSNKNEVDFYLGDIRDFDSVYSSMKDIDVVFNLAALIGIPYSYKSPKAYIDTNINGAYNVLQAALMLGDIEVIMTSTSETYGSAQKVPIDELHPLVAQSPYAATKIASDQMALSYYKSFELPVKIMRPFNIYGPRQSARAFIPSFISQALSGSDIIKVGNIFPTRDYTFVRDTADAAIEILNSKSLFGEVVNIGMNDEISISNLCDLILNLTNSKANYKVQSSRLRPEKSEVDRLYCDNSKIINSTNWRPSYNLNDGLKETIQWLESNLDKFKTETYTI
jgi:NAD dependent epimerase/dehydratase